MLKIHNFGPTTTQKKNEEIFTKHCYNFSNAFTFIKTTPFIIFHVDRTNPFAILSTAEMYKRSCAQKKRMINIFMVNFRLLHAQFSRMTRHEMGYWACIFWRGVNETLNECADSRLIQSTKMHDYNGYADEIDKNDLIWMYDIELKVGILCGKWKSVVFNNEKKSKDHSKGKTKKNRKIHLRMWSKECSQTVLWEPFTGACVSSNI